MRNLNIAAVCIFLVLLIVWIVKFSQISTTPTNEMEEWQQLSKKDRDKEFNKYGMNAFKRLDSKYGPNSR
jgi:hypothetical protein